MFKTSTCGVAPFLAGLVGLACSSQPGLGFGGAGTGGDAHGGQAGGALAGGTTGTTPEGGARGAGGSDTTAETPSTGGLDSCAYSLDESCQQFGCSFPLDWSAAQTPSAWCGINGAGPPLSVSLCRSTDGYDQGYAFYGMGGEFFLYDVATGKFAQRRADAKANYACEVGVPGILIDFSPTCAGATSTLLTNCADGGVDTGSTGAQGVDGGGAGATEDAGPSCSMSASQYDSSCKGDSDCVGVPEGDPCAGNCLSMCPTSALNVRVASQYLSDLKALSAGRNQNVVCNCPCIAAQPCCRQGFCYNTCGDCTTTN